MWGKLEDAAAVLISIGAGLYLLSEHGAAGTNSWFQVIAHGIGAYFIAKGIYMGRSLQLQRAVAESNREMLEEASGAVASES